MTLYDVLEAWAGDFAHIRTLEVACPYTERAAPHTPPPPASCLHPRYCPFADGPLGPSPCLLRVHPCCRTPARHPHVRAARPGARMRTARWPQPADVHGMRPAPLARAAAGPPRPDGHRAPQRPSKRLRTAHARGGAGEALPCPVHAQGPSRGIPAAARQSAQGARLCSWPAERPEGRCRANAPPCNLIGLRGITCAPRWRRRRS